MGRNAPFLIYLPRLLGATNLCATVDVNSWLIGQYRSVQYCTVGLRWMIQIQPGSFQICPPRARVSMAGA